MKKANDTCKVTEMGFTDQNIQKRLYKVSFAIDHDLCMFKNEGKVTDSKINAFKVGANKFLSTLCNHGIEKAL